MSDETANWIEIRYSVDTPAGTETYSWRREVTAYEMSPEEMMKAMAAAQFAIRAATGGKQP